MGTVKRMPLAIGPVRASSTMRTYDVTPSKAEIDDTALDDLATNIIPGFESAVFSCEGGFQAADFAEFASIYTGETAVPLTGGTNQVVTVGSPAAGDPANMLEVKAHQLTETNNWGERQQVSVSGAGQSVFARGKFLQVGFYGAAWSASTDGTAVDLGADVTASQSLVIHYHVVRPLAGTSPSVTLAFETDTTSAFSGSETTRHTTAAITEPSAARVVVAGPITGQWIRVTATITGTSVEARVLAAAAIVNN